MARIRAIKPEFFDSPSTAACSPWARLLYIAMWCLADDWGVGQANMKELSAFAFPNDDAWTSKELPSLCNEVADNYGVVFYTNRGRHYFAIQGWDEHQVTQRRAKRRHPTPDDAESVPDLRFHPTTDVPSGGQGTSLRTQGNAQDGTGEQGNRGTEEQVVAASTPSKRKRHEYSEQFEEFWKAYPSEGAKDKPKAYAAWSKAIKTADPADIIAGAKRYALVAKPGYTKYAQGWLTGERWNDDPPTKTHERPRRASIEELMNR